MRLLSTLFRTTPNAYEWPIIASTISAGFQIVKQQWFNECVIAVELGLFAANQVAVGAESATHGRSERVLHTDLDGNAALAITGYQIHCASSIIAENGYVSKTSTRDFLDLLCGRVSGVKPSELLKYLSRYNASNNDASTLRLKFAVDIAGYMTSEEPSMILSLHVATLAEKLFSMTSVVVAKAFGDSASVHKLSRQISLIDSRL